MTRRSDLSPSFILILSFSPILGTDSRVSVLTHLHPNLKVRKSETSELKNTSYDFTEKNLYILNQFFDSKPSFTSRPHYPVKYDTNRFLIRTCLKGLSDFRPKTNPSIRCSTKWTSGLLRLLVRGVVSNRERERQREREKERERVPTLTMEGRLCGPSTSVYSFIGKSDRVSKVKSL